MHVMFRAATAVACTIAAVGTLSTTAQASSTDSTQPAIQRVVTLGDSYSSGSGIHRNASSYDDHGPATHSFGHSTRLGSSACQRELDETPGPRFAEQLDAESVFVACAGAVIREIPAQVRAAGIRGDGDGTLITMTIGGNDLRTERSYSHSGTDCSQPSHIWSLASRPSLIWVLSFFQGICTILTL